MHMCMLSSSTMVINMWCPCFPPVLFTHIHASEHDNIILKSWTWTWPFCLVLRLLAVQGKWCPWDVICTKSRWTNGCLHVLFLTFLPFKRTFSINSTCILDVKTLSCDAVWCSAWQCIPTAASLPVGKSPVCTEHRTCAFGTPTKEWSQMGQSALKGLYDGFPCQVRVNPGLGLALYIEQSKQLHLKFVARTGTNICLLIDPLEPECTALLHSSNSPRQRWVIRRQLLRHVVPWDSYDS